MDGLLAISIVQAVLDVMNRPNASVISSQYENRNELELPSEQVVVEMDGLIPRLHGLAARSKGRLDRQRIQRGKLVVRTMH
jgi:hypothetical protein